MMYEYNIPECRVIVLDDDEQSDNIYKLLFSDICSIGVDCVEDECESYYKFHSKIKSFLADIKDNDIVVLEFILHDIKNGQDIAKVLKDKFKDIFIILYSVFVNDTSKIIDTSLFDKIITKPNAEELLNIIKEREKNYGFSCKT